MQYELNLKNIKQSATNLSKFLKDYNIPRNVLLEGMAKIFFFKNWNTLEGLATRPQIIEHINIQKRYLFEIEAQIEESTLLDLLKRSFKEGQAQFNLINFVSEKKDNTFNYFHFEIDLMKSDKNILTAMFLMCEKLKNMKVVINKFDYCRVVCEKESFMEYFNEQKNKTTSKMPVDMTYALMIDKKNYSLEDPIEYVYDSIPQHPMKSVIGSNIEDHEKSSDTNTHIIVGETIKGKSSLMTNSINDFKENVIAIREALKEGEESGEARPFDLEEFKEKMKLKKYYEAMSVYDEQEKRDVENMVKTLNSEPSEEAKAFYRTLDPDFDKKYEANLKNIAQEVKNHIEGRSKKKK
jgi:hypothetical protein